MQTPRIYVDLLHTRPKLSGYLQQNETPGKARQVLELRLRINMHVGSHLLRVDFKSLGHLFWNSQALKRVEQLARVQNSLVAAAHGLGRACKVQGTMIFSILESHQT